MTASRIATLWTVVTLVVLTLAGCRRVNFVSSSMAPSIKQGEEIHVAFTAYALAGPARWDVVAFEHPTFTNQLWIMRVVALPGETVSFAHGGITIDGRPLVVPPKLTNVSYLSLDQLPRVTGTSVTTSPYLVSSNCYFVLGDNSANAFDSRFWGGVPRRKIVGKVLGK
jgi:signal peptidase I